MSEKLSTHPQNQQETSPMAEETAAETERKKEINQKLGHTALGDRQLRDKANSDDEQLLLDYAGVIESDRTKRFSNERAQELNERAINAKLTSLEDLEQSADFFTAGIEKGTPVEYEGQKIPVYNLNGIPFKFLQTAIDFKLDKEGKTRGDNIIGTNVAARLIEDPSLWARREESVDLSDPQKLSEVEGNTISLSYVDMSRNPNSGVGSPLAVVYGFDSLVGDSVLSMKSDDGNTSNRIGRDPTKMGGYVDIDDFADASRGHYNEVHVRRYMEGGEPLRPRFMVVYNGKITDYTKKHAAFWGIPIINIDQQPYNEQNRQATISNLEKISEETDYLTIKKNLEDLSFYAVGSYADIKNSVKESDMFDKGYDDSSARSAIGNQLFEKLKRIIKEIEPKKRAEYLKTEIKKAIDNGRTGDISVTVTNRTRHGEPSDKIFKNVLVIERISIGERKKRATMAFYPDEPDYNEMNRLVKQFSDAGGYVTRFN